jgi:phospholipase C
VIVLALENPSFDHLPGFLDHPDPSVDGWRRGGPSPARVGTAGPKVTATPGRAEPVLPVDPDHQRSSVPRREQQPAPGDDRVTNDAYDRYQPGADTDFPRGKH